jgi:hypothetical protein
MHIFYYHTRLILTTVQEVSLSVNLEVHERKVTAGPVERDKNYQKVVPTVVLPREGCKCSFCRKKTAFW